MMLETLFSSRVRKKVLETFFLVPGERFNANRLSKKINENYSAVWKELNRLDEAGILQSESDEYSKEYQLDPNCPIASELQSIFLKTAGVFATLRDKLATSKEVNFAFIYGSYSAGDADRYSDLDLMIIGKIDLQDLATIIQEIEHEINRPVNYVVFPEEEWRTKRENDDPFISHIMEASKTMLIGDQNAL